MIFPQTSHFDDLQKQKGKRLPCVVFPFGGALFLHFQWTFPRKSGTITLSRAARNPSRFSKHPPAERRNPRGNQTEAIQSGAAPDRGHADDYRVPHLPPLRLRPAHRPGLHGADGQRPVQRAAVL